MRNTLTAFVFFLLTTSLYHVFGQTPDRRTGISAKRLFIDYQSTMSGEFASPMDYTGGWQVAFSRNINQYLNVMIPFQVGQAHFPGELNNRTLFGVDLLVQGQYYQKDWFYIPYAILGVGSHFIQDDKSNFQIPIGLGTNFRLGPWAYFNIQAEYRISTRERKSNLQYGLGFQFMIHSKKKKVNPVLDDKADTKIKDKDKDGIADKKDKCPDVAGVALFEGCPDTDRDGIADAEDNCPEIAGLSTNNGCPEEERDSDGDGVTDKSDSCPDLAGPSFLNGCPDDDGDGIANKDDRCPKEAGTADKEGCPVFDMDKDGVEDWEDDCPHTAGFLKGCPDMDKDGIVDSEDKCPEIPGLANTNGCPDTDNDGIADAEDRCPDVAGNAANIGCPEIKKEEREILNFATQAVQFETGSSQLKPISYTILDKIVALIENYPEHSLQISGHTDDTGDAQQNLSLSKLRAESCMNYLLAKGVKPSRIFYTGFGHSKPVADNKTKEGRMANRRVEFDLIVK